MYTETPKATKRLLLLMASYVSTWISQIPSSYEFWVKHTDSLYTIIKPVLFKGSCQKQRASNHGMYPVTVFQTEPPLKWTSMTGYDPAPRRVSQGSFTLWELGHTAWSRTNKSWISRVGGRGTGRNETNHITHSEYITHWIYCTNLRI